MGILERLAAAKLAPVKAEMAARDKTAADEAAVPGLWSAIQDQLPKDVSSAERARAQLDAMIATGNPTLIAKAMELMPDQFGQDIKVSDTKYSSYGQQAIDMGLTPGTKPFIDMVERLATMNKGTTINVGGDNEEPIPTGELGKLMLPGGNPVPFGTTPSQAKALGAVLRDTLSGESAGKTAMLETAQEEIKTIDRILGPDDIDTQILAEMLAIDTTGLASAVVSEEAGELYAAFETGMQAITRTETGAAMAKEEIDNTKKRFMPKPWDKEAVRRQKIDAYKHFINNATEYLNPINRGALTHEEYFNQAIEKSLKETGVDEKTLRVPGDTWSDSSYDYRIAPDGSTQRRAK